jgi:hypothetical protein
MNYPLGVRSPVFLASFVTSNVSTQPSAALITSIRPLPKRFPDHALGTIPSGGSALIDITVAPTVAGEITNYAADNAENQASATVTVGLIFSGPRDVA